MSRIVNSRLGYFILFVFAMALYANTLFHDFVLDDEVAIVKNAYVQKGVSGIKDIFSNDSFAGYGRIGEGESLLTGGRYRPLSIAVFAITHDLFGNNPLPFHLINILVYGLCSLVIFVFLKLLLSDIQDGDAMAFMITATFIAHPIHTEVVANVKSLDELLVLLFGVGALATLLKAYDMRSVLWLGLASIFMVLACFSKENAVMLLLITPLVFWFFRRGSFRKQWTYLLPMLLSVMVFLVVRYFVLGDIPAGRSMQDPLNNPFLEWTGSAWVACSGLTKAATIIYTLGDYLRLMIFPYPLTHDYYPFHIVLQSISSPKVILSLLSMMGLIGISLWGFLKKWKLSFGILFFLITGSVTFNIVFPVGVFMAERFIFLPSLGLILAFVTWIFPWVNERYKRPGVVFFGCAILLLSVLTINRNMAWKNNEVLMRTDILTSSNSARLRNHLGSFLLDEALVQEDKSKRQRLLEEAIPHLEKATELHSVYFDALLASGACHYYLKDYERSVQDYRTAADYYSGDEQSELGLRYALLAYGKDQWEKEDSIQAVQSLLEAWELLQEADNANQISAYYLEMKDIEKALEWRSKASALEN